MKIYDYIVIGSGCSGAMAAQTLVEAGKQVTMLDVGMRNPGYESAVPNKDFVSIRKDETDQYSYFIGKNGEGITWDKIGKGAQVTPTRYHMTKQVEYYTPMASQTFSPLESLGYGGLGIGWGLQCWKFSAVDSKKAGLDPKNMDQAYEVVSSRIGISATRDSAQIYTMGSLGNFMESPVADRNHKAIQKQYAKRDKLYRGKGFFVGRTPLALLTKDQDGRKAYQYRDMDFYDDNGMSAWRPWVTVNQLLKMRNFTYKGSCLVTEFSEDSDLVHVKYVNTETSKTESVGCRKLILASGALGTARIVLRSLGNESSTLPLLSNPHTYIPCLQPLMIGKGIERHRLGLGQLSYFIDPEQKDDGISIASSYSYQSLLMFRIINQIPFGYAFGRKLLQYIMSSFVVVIVQHPDSSRKDKYLKLIPSKESPTGDKLYARYLLSNEEEIEWKKREKQYIKYLRKLRVFALKRVQTEHGSAIHYAGTVPFSSEERPLHQSSAGRIYGTKHVYAADSSGFTYLPAKGVTFSLMANAHIIADNIIKGKE